VDPLWTIPISSPRLYEPSWASMTWSGCGRMPPDGIDHHPDSNNRLRKGMSYLKTILKASRHSSFRLHASFVRKFLSDLHFSFSRRVFRKSISSPPAFPRAVFLLLPRRRVDHPCGTVFPETVFYVRANHWRLRYVTPQGHPALQYQGSLTPEKSLGVPHRIFPTLPSISRIRCPHACSLHSSASGKGVSTNPLSARAHGAKFR